MGHHVTRVCNSQMQARESAAADREEKLTSLHASLKALEVAAAKLEGQLDARVQDAESRERKTVAAAAEVAASKAECAERWRQVGEGVAGLTIGMVS